MKTFLILALAVLGLIASPAYATEATPSSATASSETITVPANPPAPLILAEGEGSVVELLHLDTMHLVALGAGLIAGPVLIAPYFQLSELAAIVTGLMGGEVFYRTILAPFENKSWLY